MSPTLTRAEKLSATTTAAKLRLRKPRACDGCGDTYSRRNLVEAWTVQNQGHRIGWTKTILKLCVKKCSPAAAARRIVDVARRSSQ